MRSARTKYSIYFDPAGEAPTEHEMYDLERDPEERRNLLELRTGEPLDRADAGARDDAVEQLRAEMERCRTAPGP